MPPGRGTMQVFMARKRTRIVLPARGRFDLRATVLLQDRHALPPFRWHDGPRPVLERAEQLSDGPAYLLRIWQVSGGVMLEATGRDAGEIEVLAPLAARVRRALALDQDVAAFRAACTHEPLLRPAAALAPGRLLRGTSTFEDVVKVLAGSNRRPDRALRSIERLIAFGRRCPARPALRAFPSPEALAGIPLRHLAARTGLGHRAAWIRMLARAVAAQRSDLEAAERLPIGDAADLLRDVPGLGPISVARLLLLLGHTDTPALDRASRSFARRALGGEGRPLERWLHRQKPWRGVALWCAQRLADPASAALLRRSWSPATLARRAGRS